MLRVARTTPELQSMADSAPIRLAADVGGTFTDVAAFNETTGELHLGKSLTTPAHLCPASRMALPGPAPVSRRRGCSFTVPPSRSFGVGTKTCPPYVN